MPAPCINPASCAPADIADLWRRFSATPGPDLLNQIATFYMPFLRFHAAHVAAGLPRSVTLDDVESAGQGGLLAAIRRFDPARGVKFETFAVKIVRGAMCDYLRSLDFASRTRRQNYNRAQAARDDFFKAHGHGPAEPSPHDNLVRMIRFGDTDPSGDRQPVRDRAASRSPVLDAAQRADLKEYLTQRLDRRDRLVVILIYFEGMTMKEVGLTIGLSESRVSQMHKEIVQRLRDRLHARESELWLGR